MSKLLLLRLGCSIIKLTTVTVTGCVLVRACCVDQRQVEAVKHCKTAMTGCFRTTHTNDFKASPSVLDCRSEQTSSCLAKLHGVRDINLISAFARPSLRDNL